MPYVLYPFCHKNPGAHIPETAFPDPYLFTKTENPIVNAILALLSKTGLTLPSTSTCANDRGRVLYGNSGRRRG